MNESYAIRSLGSNCVLSVLNQRCLSETREVCFWLFLQQLDEQWRDRRAQCFKILVTEVQVHNVH